MGFVICKKIIGGQNIRYERVKPLKLGGPDGLIARHVKSLPAQQTTAWKLDVLELLNQADIAGDDFTVLFDATGGDAAAVCFYELTRVHGTCRDASTTLALDFEVVLDCERKAGPLGFAAAFDAPRDAPPKKLAETLLLTGGPGGGDWKWGKPALQLGATMVQLSPNHPYGMNRACNRGMAA